MTNEELIKLIQKPEENNYQKSYDMLISSGKIRGLDKKNLDYYTEKHHIIPRCMGGKDEDENYVLLTYPEHIIAHILLYKIYPNNCGLTVAANTMITVDRYSADVDSFINDIRESTLELLEEINRNSRVVKGKSIVCTNNSGKVLKVYETMSDTTLDGFNFGSIHSCIKYRKGNHYYGYNWYSRDKFEEEYGAILNAEELKQTKIIPIPPRLVCHSSGKIYYIFEDSMHAYKAGFNFSSISIVLNTNKLHGKYNWSSLEQFIQDYNYSMEDINNFKNPAEYPKYYSHVLLACIDPKTKKIVKIYKDSYETEEDGFNRQALITRADGIHTCQGYIWKSAKKLSLTELEEYYSRDFYETPINKGLAYIPIREDIIQIDPDTKDIIAIWKFPGMSGELIKHKYHGKEYREAIKYDRIYKKTRWRTRSQYEKEFPDKLKEYESRSKNSIEAKA